MLLSVGGLCIGISHAMAVGDAGQVPRVLAAALARVPATWVMTALVMLLFGISGRLTVWAWVALVGIIVLGEFGPVMNFPTGRPSVSPFAHVPELPGAAFSWPPLVVADTGRRGVHRGGTDGVPSGGTSSPTDGRCARGCSHGTGVSTPETGVGRARRRF